MKTRDEKKEDYRNEGSIMQLKITTDYAVRIVYYLALRKETVTAAQLSEALKIPESYIPKITKKLKEANIITACEGIKGGYSLAKITKRLKYARMTFRRNYFMVFCKPVY